MKGDAAQIDQVPRRSQHTATTNAPPRGSSWRRRGKFFLFACTPALLLVLLAEVGLRLVGAAVPSLQTIPLPEQLAGVMRPDDELFWSLQPDFHGVFLDQPVNTNSLGLRSPPLGPKAPGTVRILSLGESTTFGAGVADDETYASVLQRELQTADPAHRYEVINAGVSAYSSFQSLLYLKRRGLALEPDIVLFYHEFNDYLPTSFREGATSEVDVAQTDRQRYQSAQDTWRRRLWKYSAIYRFVSFYAAGQQIEQLQTHDLTVPWAQIGMPDHSFTPRPRVVTELGDEGRDAMLNERALPTRVSPDERRENLAELVEVCRAHDIRLVIIHPSYRDTQPHECVLTEFCRTEQVPMFEAYDCLHPPNASPGALYWDIVHPTREGHAALGAALARFLLDNQLVPGKRS
ncbi:MAG: SGNH/GDSL hydrolase family protein [Pirellulales bacterium]